MIGKVIGNYQITGEIAHGGMGSVYRARHLNLPREVVVKSIRLAAFPPPTQEHLKARFRREAYIQSQLDHPGIVRVYEFFTTEENYYLVQEFIAGLSLRDLVERQGAVAPPQAVQLLKQALSALDYAHNFHYVDESGAPRAGIIHRDIKPANLLLDGRANLKITDFGIVKMAGERSMTQTGFNPGTVEYMSPEQLKGFEIDARSDLYSLGVTFFEVLAGRLPFPHSETGSDYEVRKGHIEVEPPSISELRPSVPPALAAIIKRSLAKDPADRFQSAAEFLNAIHDYEGVGYEATVALSDRETQSSSPARTAIDRTAPPTDGGTAPLATQPMPETPAPMGVRPEAPTPPLPPEPSYKPSPDPVVKRSGLPPLLVAGAAALAVLIAASIAAYFLLRSDDAPSTVAPEVSVSAPASANASRATVSPELERLLGRAQEQEKEERYTEAITLYNEYLRGTPSEADAAEVSARVAQLKRFQGLLTVAKLELDRGDYEAARSAYDEALKLRPDSQLARTGFEEAQSRRKK
jgi:serine/threonine-protein kinase